MMNNLCFGSPFLLRKTFSENKNENLRDIGGFFCMTIEEMFNSESGKNGLRRMVLVWIYNNWSDSDG